MATQNTAPSRTNASEATTLAIDVGGTGLKAAVLDMQGKEVSGRVRVDTTYPMPPVRLVDTLVDLVAGLPPYDRVSVGFPGVVRGNAIVTAPHFVTEKGPGSKISPDLLRQWRRFGIGDALASRLGKPVRVANDADVQGAGVVSGHGLELVVTLGTGVGTGLFFNGAMAPHLEIAHHPFRKAQTYNDQIGNAALQRIGRKKWNKRVHLAVETLDALVNYDHLYIGGGNSSKVSFDLGPRATVVGNEAGILGGIKLWEREHL